jgi:hypothetical protein
MHSSKSLVAVAALLLACGSRVAALPVEDLLACCGSETIAQADEKAAAQAWRPVPAGELEEWRGSFVAHHRREVVVRAGGVDEHEGAERISYWIAQGLGGHAACSYPTSQASELLARLSATLGAPVSLDMQASGATAVWNGSGRDVTFSQVGANAVVSFTRPRL